IILYVPFQGCFMRTPILFKSTVRKKKSALVNILAAGLVGTIFVVQGSAQDTKTPRENKAGTWSLAIHGGAGGDPK
ncbi:MAG: hypothetical protein ACK578_04380, partial [Pirellula sp.]